MFLLENIQTFFTDIVIKRSLYGEAYVIVILNVDLI